MISPELQAKIQRLYHVEKWPIGTIARQLRIHHTTVRRALVRSGARDVASSKRPSLIDRYMPFILEILERHPRLPASRLYQMVRDRGYRGGPDHFRHLIALHRPRPPAEAYLRLRTLPGEQAQVDWAHFGKLTIGRAEHSLVAFTIVLSWSRQIFLRFFLDQRLENFLRGHEAAFQAWNGSARVLLYDNLKSAVLERQGDAIRFHPTLLEFAAHYRFEPRPVAIGRGNEKGRVERAIRYVRTSFFPARKWKDLEDLNAQALAWCDGIASDRRCPEDRTLTVREAFAQERAQLLPLPDNPYPTDEREEITVHKTPYLRFDGNDYSVPHDHCHRTLVVLASPEKVRIFDGTELIVTHCRSYSKNEQIEDPTHIEALIASKRQARQHRGMDRLHHVAPSSAEILQRLAQRGENLGSVTAALLRLLDQFGAHELEEAMLEALDKDAPHPHSVRLVLERRLRQRGTRPKMPVNLPDDPRLQDLVVRPHSLDSYDSLGRKDDTDDTEE
jgi:transposase